MAAQQYRELPLPRLFGVVASDIPYETDERLADACGTRIAFFGRLGGASTGAYSSLNLGKHVGDGPDAVDGNRGRALLAAGLSAYGQHLMVPNQVHGTHIVSIDDPGALPYAEFEDGADGCIVSALGVPVLMNFADCTPVAIVAPGGMFALAHAGWRGALAGICGMAVNRLASAAGCEASALNAYIGPHIGPCCYEVAPERLDAFVVRYGASCDAGHRRLSLSAACRADLAAAGIVEARIAESSSCTSCDQGHYFSYRASGGICGRQGMLACREA